MSSFNYILIGPGKISHFHYEVFQNNDFNLVSIFTSNMKSQSLKKFLIKFKIKNINVSNNIKIIDRDFIKMNNIKFILLSTSYNQTPKILKKLKKLDVVILVEKPVSINIDWFKRLNFNEFKNVKVAFNRRFYNNVDYLKNVFKKSIGNITNLTIEIPEKIFLNEKNHNNIYKKYYSNSAHLIDLLFYFFGDIKIKDVDYFNKKKSKSFFVIFSFNKNLKGIINFMFNSPMQFKISFDINHLKYDLCPIENLKVYNELEIKSPSKKNPIRSYHPKLYKTIISDELESKTKPGFNKQAIAIKRLIKMKNINNNFANLKDAFKVQMFLTDIMKMLKEK